MPLPPPVADPAPRLYNLFPTLAGPLSQWPDHMDRVVAMVFDWIYVNPIHYPGFSGSLYAVKDIYRLHPALDDGSGRSADAQIRAMLDEAHARGLKVMLDLVVNHTAKDSPWVSQHPDWYVRDRRTGAVQSPFAIDPANADNRTVWGDLAELDYTPRPARERLVAQFAAVVRHYVTLGVDGFRCDAAYKVPAEVWAALIGEARAIRPQTLFAAETLGCRLSEIEGLRPAGFDYLFNSSKWWDFREPWLMSQYAAFRSLAPSIAFPESHDTPRLCAELPADWPADRVAAAYRRAWLFTSVFSSGSMMPMGFEYGFATKPDVVRTRPGDWETPAFDLTDFVAQTNAMKASLRVLNWEGPQDAVDLDDAVCLLVRRAEHDPDVVLTVVNRDTTAPQGVDGEVLRQRVAPLGLSPETPLVEVTPGQTASGAVAVAAGGGGTLDLEPGALRVFAHDARASS